VVARTSGSSDGSARASASARRSCQGASARAPEAGQGVGLAPQQPTPVAADVADGGVGRIGDRDPLGDVLEQRVQGAPPLARLGQRARQLGVRGAPGAHVLEGEHRAVPLARRAHQCADRSGDRGEDVGHRHRRAVLAPEHLGVAAAALPAMARGEQRALLGRIRAAVGVAVVDQRVLVTPDELGSRPAQDPLGLGVGEGRAPGRVHAQHRHAGGGEDGLVALLGGLDRVGARARGRLPRRPHGRLPRGEAQRDLVARHGGQLLEQRHVARAPRPRREVDHAERAQHGGRRAPARGEGVPGRVHGRVQRHAEIGAIPDSRMAGLSHTSGCARASGITSALPPVTTCRQKLRSSVTAVAHAAGSCGGSPCTAAGVWQSALTRLICATGRRARARRGGRRGRARRGRPGQLQQPTRVQDRQAGGVVEAPAPAPVADAVRDGVGDGVTRDDGGGEGSASAMPHDDIRPANAREATGTARRA
jgi:hypothetical protein